MNLKMTITSLFLMMNLQLFASEQNQQQAQINQSAQVAKTDEQKKAEASQRSNLRYEWQDIEEDPLADMWYIFTSWSRDQRYRDLDFVSNENQNSNQNQTKK